MVKRVITKISLSTFVLATGLFLWSNVEQAKAAQVASTNTQAQEPCWPGGPTWPKCIKEEK